MTNRLPSPFILSSINPADPLYEDPRTEVRRLLDKYHFGRYKVYNFASELAQMAPTADVVDTRVERSGVGFIRVSSATVFFCGKGVAVNIPLVAPV